MPVSGLVVTLSNDPDRGAEAINAIDAEPSLEIGTTVSQRMAVVMDTQSSEADKALWNWLQSLPGVVFVDVAMVGFEETDAEPRADVCQ